MNYIKSNETFCYFSLYLHTWTGNQHGGRECDDLQNLLDMTSHENPYRIRFQTRGDVTARPNGRRRKRFETRWNDNLKLIINIQPQYKLTGCNRIRNNGHDLDLYWWHVPDISTEFDRRPENFFPRTPRYTRLLGAQKVLSARCKTLRSFSFLSLNASLCWWRHLAPTLYCNAVVDKCQMT